MKLGRNFLVETVGVIKVRSWTFFLILSDSKIRNFVKILANEQPGWFQLQQESISSAFQIQSSRRNQGRAQVSKIAYEIIVILLKSFRAIHYLVFHDRPSKFDMKVLEKLAKSQSFLLRNQLSIFSFTVISEKEMNSLQESLRSRRDQNKFKNWYTVLRSESRILSHTVVPFELLIAEKYSQLVKKLFKLPNQKYMERWEEMISKVLKLDSEFLRTKRDGGSPFFT